MVRASHRGADHVKVLPRGPLDLRITVLFGCWASGRSGHLEGEYGEEFRNVSRRHIRASRPSAQPAILDACIQKRQLYTYLPTARMRLIRHPFPGAAHSTSGGSTEPPLHTGSCGEGPSRCPTVSRRQQVCCDTTGFRRLQVGGRYRAPDLSADACASSRMAPDDRGPAKRSQGNNARLREHF